MALGTDQWAAKIALELSIPYIAAVPFRGQESRCFLGTSGSLITLMNCWPYGMESAKAAHSRPSTTLRKSLDIRYM